MSSSVSAQIRAVRKVKRAERDAIMAVVRKYVDRKVSEWDAYEVLHAMQVAPVHAIGIGAIGFDESDERIAYYREVQLLIRDLSHDRLRNEIKDEEPCIHVI